MSLPLILASTSVYRKQLLDRLGIPYQAVSPSVDETILPNESPTNLVQRLAQAKARSVASNHSQALIIGSDQVAVLHDHILGKPGTHPNAVKQLKQASGHKVTFITSVCLYNSATSQIHEKIIPYHVTFRTLSTQLIERYLRREQPYDCAGSFKSEGLGIALFDHMEGEDPTALVGLPLIGLRKLLQKELVEVI